MRTLTRLSIWLLSLSLLVLSFPVSAQQITPVPQTTTTIVRDLADAAERLSILGFVAAVIALTALGIVGIVLLALWKVGLKPFTDAADAARADRTESEKKLAEKQAQDAARELELTTIRQSTAAALERTVNVLTELETRAEAKQGRAQAVSTINTHTTNTSEAQFEAIKNLLDKALKGIQVVQQKQERRAATEGATADLTLPVVEANLREAQKEVEKLNDTGKLPPLPDSDASGSADTAA